MAAGRLCYSRVLKCLVLALHTPVYLVVIDGRSSEQTGHPLDTPQLCETFQRSHNRKIKGPDNPTCKDPSRRMKECVSKQRSECWIVNDVHARVCVSVCVCVRGCVHVRVHVWRPPMASLT